MSALNTPRTASVLTAHGELAELLAWWRDLDSNVRLDAAADEARRLLVAEARLLDDERYDDWLAGWADDGLLWVPLDRASNPAADQALYLDDVRRLGERIRWRRQTNAWSQHPAPRTVRAVGNVESFVAADGTLRTRSSVIIHEHRDGRAECWSGHQFHLFTAADGERRRRQHRKIVVLPALRGPVTHPAVVL